LQCLKEFFDFTYIKTPAAVAFLQELKSLLAGACNVMGSSQKNGQLSQFLSKV
jgi:hypothetical protein